MFVAFKRVHSGAPVAVNTDLVLAVEGVWAEGQHRTKLTMALWSGDKSYPYSIEVQGTAERAIEALNQGQQP